MKVKVKKKNPDGVVKLETSGELKEIIMNEDFLNPKDESIALCFKGKSSSGIIELSKKEFELLSREMEKKKHLFGNVKVMKFEE